MPRPTYEINSWASLDATFKTFSVPVQTGIFPWSFRVTPSVANVDTVVGLAPGPVSAYTDMSCIVQFTDTGIVNVMDLNAYTTNAGVTFPYTGGTSYDVAFSINMGTSPKSYSVTITPVGGSTTTLATNFRFRSSQATPTQLSSVGMYTTNGTSVVSNMLVGTDVTAPIPNPSTFATPPTALDSFRVTMTATTATDDFSPPVQYRFWENTGHTGGTDSGWIASPTYVDTGLSPSTTYSYFVWTRDNNLNEGSASSTLSVTTPAQVTQGTVNCNTLNVTTLRVGP